MNAKEISEETRGNEKALQFASYVLVALMMACAAMTAVSFLHHVFPGWYPLYMVGICFLVTIDRLYTYRRFKFYVFPSSEWATAYLTQWFIILLVIKVATGLNAGWDAFLAELPRWASEFSTYFLDYHFIISVLMALAAWGAAGYFASLIDDLGVEQAIIFQEMDTSRQAELRPAHERLMNFIITIGAALIVLTALSRVNLRTLFVTSYGEMLIKLPMLAGGGASTLLYFMLGLALLSQAKLFALHTRWSLQRLNVSRQLAQRWALYTIIFLLALAVMVAFLPTSYSLGFLSVLSAIFNAISWFVLTLVQVFIGLIFLLMSLPALLAGKPPPIQETRVPSESMPTPTPITLPDVLPDAAPSAGRMIIFWVILLVLIVFAVSQYLRQHKEILQAMRKIPGMQFMAQVWQWIVKFWAGAKGEVARIVESQRERQRARREAQKMGLGNGFLSLRRLDPRQKIYFFYLALVRRGGEIGLTRDLSQTPTEYAATLEKNLPEDVDPDIESLTSAFNEARYSRHPVQPEDAGLVRKYWENIRKVLRKKK